MGNFAWNYVCSKSDESKECVFKHRAVVLTLPPPPPHIPLNWLHFNHACFPNLSSNWKIADLTRSLVFKGTWCQNGLKSQTMSLPNVFEAHMIAVLSTFCSAVTALREVLNSILSHVLTFLLHYILIVFIPHSFLPVRPSVGITCLLQVPGLPLFLKGQKTRNPLGPMFPTG